MFKKWFGGGSKKDKKSSPRGGGGDSGNEYGLYGAGSYESGSYGGRRGPRVASINLESDLPSSQLVK